MKFKKIRAVKDCDASDSILQLLKSYPHGLGVSTIASHLHWSENKTNDLLKKMRVNHTIGRVIYTGKVCYVCMKIEN